MSCAPGTDVNVRQLFHTHRKQLHTIIRRHLTYEIMGCANAQDCATDGGRRLQLSHAPQAQEAWSGAYGKGDALDLTLKRPTEAC